jgi:sugar O-acyltransferase (sialic acid O-acetyltransferase NeuD family)
MKPAVIFGAGGHARVVADIWRLSGQRLAGFVHTPGTGVCTVPGEEVLGGDELLDDPAFVIAHEFIIGIAAQLIRRRLAEWVRSKGGVLITAIHPRAVVAAGVPIGAGSALMAGSVVNPGTVVGECVIINTGATVDHDCVLADGVHIAPGAHLAGGVTCGEDAFVGTGAVVIQGRHIGARAVVGAGAVVIADVADATTVVGCPARVITPRKDQAVS